MCIRDRAYTELSAAALLHRYRTEQADFLEDSFETIAAYGPHAAVVHYEMCIRDSHFPCLARRLSAPYTKNVTRLISTR